MFLLDTSTLVTSASDLKLASECEFAFLRMLDYRLGRIEVVPVDDDPMVLKAGELGDVHEQKQLAAYRAEFRDRVIELERPDSRDTEALRSAAAATKAALESGAGVVFRAVFFDETDPARPLLGYVDFIVRRPDGRWRVQDTKQYMEDQLALYHEQLVRLGAERA